MRYKRFYFIGLICILLSCCNVYLSASNVAPISLTCNSAVYANNLKTNNVATDNKSKDSKQQKPSSKTKNSALDKLLKVLTGIFAVVIFVFIIKLFKKNNNNKSLPEKKTESTPVLNEEVESVSDAVCSFVKHRIKYK